MKNIKILATAIFVSASIIACKNNNSQDVEVKMATAQTLDVEVVNSIDPVCEMEMPKFLKDTATYSGHLYGFCNEMCKKSFLEEPEKYLKKLEEL